jgi:S1-C subfamily serine protease
VFSESDDIDDGEPQQFGPRPPIAERMWQHPAEFALEARQVQRRRRDRRLAFLALGSVLGAGVITSIGFRSDDRPLGASPPVIAITDTTQADAIDPLVVWAHEVTGLARTSTLIVHSPDDPNVLALALAVGPDGFLVTSRRALGDRASFVVHTPAGTTHTAELRGSDARTDIAVLEIDGTTVGVVTALTPPDTGDLVAVVDGFDSARSAKVISATGIARTDDGDPLVGFFSLSTANNDAMAGSPIVDADGAVAGIAAHVSNTDTATGVPIGVVRRVATAIIESGGVAHPWLGVSLAEPGPAIVTAVVSDGPASLAGIAPLDVIKALGGEPTHSAAALVAALLELEPGHTVELHIDRNGETLTVWFDLGAQPVD